MQVPRVRAQADRALSDSERSRLLLRGVKWPEHDGAAEEYWGLKKKYTSLKS